MPIHESRPIDPQPTGSPLPAAPRQAYWRKTRRLTGTLLVVWFVVTFGVGFFARDLNFSFFGWPFSFWVGAQGALLVYLALVGYHAHAMHQHDLAHGVAEDD